MKFWGFHLNDKFIEDSLKGMREVETRDHTKKHLHRVIAWQTPTNLSLLKQCKLEEVEVQSCVSPPTEFDFKKCFSMSYGEDVREAEAKELVMLSGVRGGQPSWATHTPASEQDRFADLAVLLDLCDKGSFGLVAETWKSNLVPEGRFIRYACQCFFVVRVYKRAVLAWPAEVSRGVVRLSTRATQLSFLVVYNLADLQVYRQEVKAPIATMSGRRKGSHCIAIHLEEPPLSIEAYHTECCWSGLNEATLRGVYEEFQMPLPEQPEDTSGAEGEIAISMAVDLACKFNPDLDETTAIAKVLESKSLADMEDLPDIDMDWLKDNSLEQDVQDIQKYYDNHQQRRAKAKQKVASVAGFVRSCWARSSGGSGAKPKSKVLSDTQVDAAAARQYAKLNSSADTFLRASVPDGTRIFTDTFNGRWKVSFRPGSAQRSISWTKVGEQHAPCVALRWAWDQKFLHDGTAMPPESAALCQRLGI